MIAVQISGRRFGRGSVRGFALWMILGPTLTICPALQAAESWQDETYHATLENDALEATFQAGRLVELFDKLNGRILLKTDPQKLPNTIPLFGKRSIDLDASSVEQKVKPGGLEVTIQADNRINVRLHYSIEPGAGDLILQISAESPELEGSLRYDITGFDMFAHNLVMVAGGGVGHVYPAPWKGSANGAVPIALFEGDGQGWLVEARGNENWHTHIVANGKGTATDLRIQRNIPIPTRKPGIMEIRIRAYKGHWADAVDPHIAWMEQDAGYARLGTGHHPEWVKDIKVQTYVRVGDFDRLEVLAKRVDPARTVVGREVAYRHHPIGHYWPDFAPTETAKRWFRRARDLGFHVGAHVNPKGIDYRNPELLERFRRGLLEVGTFENGDPKYEGTDTFAYCSAALKPFRDYVIAQCRELVDAGVDMIYWDQTASGGGQPIVDGVDGSKGLILLMKETLEAYPGVAVETEQFNPMSARYASFALSQMGTGHPLGGYIFHNFINILPESHMVSPTREIAMDSNQSFGFFLPSATEESWVQIAEAFLEYGLVPDVRLPRHRFSTYIEGGGGGIAPVFDERIGTGGVKLFGYRGRDGVTAYFEKHPDRRGLVIYAPGKEPLGVGTRITGVSEWKGPGVVREWEVSVGSFYDPLLFNGNTIIGLDSGSTYALEEGGRLDHDRFHVTSIPDDFARWSEPNWRIRHQDIGHDGSFYQLFFSGHGEMAMAVPDDRYDVYLNGESVEVDPVTRTAVVEVDADPDDPAQLLAVQQKDVELKGPCVDFPWEAPNLQRSWYFGRHVMQGYPADGPAQELEPCHGFYIHVGGTGQIVGRIPESKSIRLQGAYGQRQVSLKSRGTGIVRVNGGEVLNIDPGEPPFRIQSFDVDLTPYAGQYVHLEFASEGEARDSVADWFAPVIVAR